MKILITGFEPFQNEKINPSQLLLEAYQAESRYQTLLLPVSYQRAWQVLESRLKIEKYDFILMLGQAGGRKLISLERTAVNLEDSKTADEDGDLRIEKKISSSGPDAYLSPLPLRNWLETLQSKELPVETSLSAGAFVCNSISYRVAHYCHQQNLKTHSLFVHMPYLPAQMAGKPEGTPSLELSQIKKTMDELLKLIESFKA